MILAVASLVSLACGPSALVHYQIDIQLTGEVPPSIRREALRVTIERLQQLGSVRLAAGADSSAHTQRIQLSTSYSVDEGLLTWMITSKRDAYMTAYTNHGLLSFITEDSSRYLVRLAEQYIGSSVPFTDVPNGLSSEEREEVLAQSGYANSVPYFAIPQGDTATVGAAISTIRSAHPELAQFFVAWHCHYYEQGNCSLMLLDKGVGRVDFSFDQIAEASAILDAGGYPAISLSLKPHEHQRLEEFTQQYTEYQVPFILDGQVLIAPLVQSSIPNGEIEISGNFSLSESKSLATLLSAKPLPKGVAVTVTNIKVISDK